MAVFTHIETDTGTNVDISAATAVGAYTSTGDKLIMVDVSIDQVAGNGDYVMYVTRRIGGAGSAYRILPQTTMAAASGLTAISGQSGWITVRNGDVLTCYVDGLAGDTSTPDWSTRWFELAGVTAAAVADAVCDEALSGHTTAGSVGEQLTFAAAQAEEANQYAQLARDDTSNILADTNELQTDLVNGGRLDLLIDSIITHLTDIKGAGWTNQTLVKIVSDIATMATAANLAALDGKVDTVDTILDDLHDTDIPAIKTETAAILEDTGTTLDALIKDIPTNAELATALGTADDAVLAAIATAKSVIDNIHDTDLPAVKTETALILEDTGTTLPATLGTLATTVHAQEIEDKVDAVDNFVDTEVAAILAAVDTEVAAIKAKTDNLPANTATALAAIQSDLDNPAQYKADVSGLATTAHVQEVENKIDAIDVTVNTIPTNPLLDTAYTAPDNAGIAAIQEKTDQLVFTTPNKVDATATVDTTGIATSAALAVVDSNVDAIKLKTDALDVSSVTVVTAVNGSTITILRGDTFSGALTNIGALTDYVSIDFTVKEAYSKTDDEATIRIRKNASGTDDGLMRLNGAAALSSALGSIAIDDLVTGDITITLDETATDDLSTGTYVYDIQMISAAGVKTLTYGRLIVSADVTRLVA